MSDFNPASDDHRSDIFIFFSQFSDEHLSIFSSFPLRNVGRKVMVLIRHFYLKFQQIEYLGK